MAASAEIKFGKWAPDMFLYHSEDSYYDLLVSDDSRLVSGLLAVKPLSSEWETVSNRKDQSKQEQKSFEKERLLTNDDSKDDDVILDEAPEEVTLLRGKMSGHRRTVPQAAAENVTPVKLLTCSLCKHELES